MNNMMSIVSSLVSRMRRSGTEKNINESDGSCRDNSKKDEDGNAGKAVGDMPTDLLPIASSSWTDSFSDKTVSYVDKNAIDYFVRSARSSGRMAEGTDPDPDSVLKEFGMVGPDGNITLAAALLFGKPNDAVNGSIVKIGEFSDKGELLREELIDLPVIMQPDAAVKALFERYIPDTLADAGAGVNAVNKYSHKAIREAVVNAIVHKQYERREPVLISVNADSIEIYNPGQLPDGWVAEDLVTKHHSVRRNERMAEVFRQAGLLGSWGNGISMMCKESEKNGNPIPEFTVRQFGLEVMFRSNDISHVPESSSSDLDALDRDAGPGSNSRLSVSEAMVCRLISENEGITAREMSFESGLSERHIYRITKDLSERGIIRREGSRKSGLWRLIINIDGKAS